MKKKIFLSLAFAWLLSMAYVNTFAQVEKGNVLINAGVGLGYYYAGGVSLGVNGEYAFTDDISGGLYLAYTRWDYGYFGYDYHYTFIDFGARASYHFARLLNVTNEKFDPYAGAFLGYVSSTFSYDGGTSYTDPYGGAVRTGIFAGARYFFSPNVGAFGEVGIGLSPLSLGVSFKF